MRLLCTGFMLAVALLATSPVRADLDDQIKKPVTESIRIRQATQKQEERWRDDKEKLIARYETLVQQEKQLMQRRQDLEEKTNAAKSRIAAKQNDLAAIEEMQSSIIPLIEAQITELQHHVTADLPFLPEERQVRLQRLEALRQDPEVAVSEKFRKVMEALLIEAEYGNTIEVYQQNIAIEGRDMLVNIFRLGRISLFFQTLDEKTCGFFNVAASAWQPLPASYNRTIQAAMDIGAKRRPVELLSLPLGRMRVP